MYHPVPANSRQQNPTMTRFCLIRHGETPWNAERRIQGQLDIGLNATGEAQARALGAGLAGQHFTAVYSSDLARAWHTAVVATQDLDLPNPRPEASLRERHYGLYQGLTVEEALARHPEIHHHHRQRSLDYDYGTGETRRAFATRALEGLTRLAERHPGGTLLAFTHGGILDIVYRAATGRDLSGPRDFPVPNAAMNWLEYASPRWTILAWADRRHLERALDEVVE
jgi:probable phosphoglycerate mutase